ncbi:ABC transporter permease [Paenibacillus sp. NEAU-GSW1]|uniref:ABC transporter permease n=1 Tax=Paenibacillus sp. NEAU-GSW1 TaxID=2682486 RepID=UPI0012E2EB4F|nr:ABC transporter permease [Paenibacillus sp. NEAU-GSW1]MUT64745.1 ABC transporter permease [Paenibacillus sp. NEAU-GSW1]
MYIIIRTMLAGIFRDVHTLVWTILFPIAMLLGLGLYFHDIEYSERLLSGVLTTNVLFGAAMVTAFYVMSHRNRGIYKLLRVTPFSTAAFIGATTVARTVLTLLVSCSVILISVLVLGVKLTVPGLLMMLTTLLIGTVCFTAIGFIAANLSKDESNVNMISNLISFPMLLTSEAFYSLQNAPEWVRVIGRLLPFHYFVKSMEIAIQQPFDITNLMPLVILIVFTALCLAAAVFTFRWDTEGSVFRLRKNGLSS